MRILYLYQYFRTREAYGSTRSYEFVRRLLRDGHEVTVVTSTARMAGLRGQRGTIRTVIDGVTIRAIGSSYSNVMPYGQRAVEFLRFVVFSFWMVFRVPRPDVIFASSTPLTVAIPALAGRILRRVPLVFEVRDLWPEVPAAMGIVRNRLLIALARRLATTTYRFSETVVTLSPGMRDGVLRHGIPPERVLVVPNGSDLDLFRPGADDGALRRRLGLETAFLVVHPGTMGVVNGLEFLVPVCEHLERALPTAVICLMGEGGQRSRLEAAVREARLANLRFFDPVPKSAMPEWLAAADLGLMIIRRLPILEMNSANKFFDYAAAGLPCLMNYGGWKAELLARYGAGRAVPTDDAGEFARVIADLAGDPALLRRMREGARRMAEQEFDREAQYQKVKTCLQAAAASRSVRVGGSHEGTA